MILKATGIKKVYEKGANALRILRGIDLQVEAGEVLAIVGPSGAGKSTLLHILGGLDDPTDGQVILDGEDIYRLNDRKRAVVRNQKVGFIFQFYHLLPEFTALENVSLPALVAKQEASFKKVKERAEALLEDIGLKDRLHHKPSELSGGEQQRVAIARALINEPQIIFCDEPTGNLDSERGEKIFHQLLKLNKVNKQTLLIVTHEKRIAMNSHRVIQMRDGLFVNEEGE